MPRRSEQEAVVSIMAPSLPATDWQDGQSSHRRMSVPTNGRLEIFRQIEPSNVVHLSQLALALVGNLKLLICCESPLQERSLGDVWLGWR